MRNYSSSLNNDKKPTSNPEFPFICATNTMCLLCAILSDNNTSVTKVSDIVLLSSQTSSRVVINRRNSQLYFSLLLFFLPKIW